MAKLRFRPDSSGKPWAGYFRDQQAAQTRPSALVRLGYDTSGAAAVEYALLCGVIISVTCVAMTLLGYSVRMAIAPLPNELQSSHVAVENSAGESATQAGGESLHGAEQTISDVPATRRSPPNYALFMPLVSAVLLAASWLALRRERKRREVALAERNAEEEEDPESLQLRIQAKRQSLWRNLLNDSDLLLKNRIEVRYLMTRNPVVTSPNASFEEVHTLMTSKGLRHLLVCDNRNRLLGLISEKDLRGNKGKKARRLMNASPNVVAPDTPISTAITRLTENGLSCLPVIDEQKQVRGILTSVDLIITLQCALQFCGRLAQATQANPEWARDVEAVSNGMAQGVDDQRRRLSRLRERFANGGDALHDSWEKEFFEEAEALLATTSELTDLARGAHNRISQQTEQLMGSIAPRTDLLTGLSNRRELDGIFKMMLALSNRHDHSLTFALIAVDHFQAAGAAGGEHWATNTLCSLATLIVDAVRESDFVTRFDEDSFAVVMPSTDLAGAELCCQRIRQAVGTSPDFADPVSVSAGLVAVQRGECSAELLKRAEMALSDAQAEGGDRVNVDSNQNTPAAGDVASV